MCELRSHLHPAVAAGRNGPLPLQRVRPVPQDERPEPTPYQAKAQTGESMSPPELFQFPSHVRKRAK